MQTHSECTVHRTFGKPSIVTLVAQLVDETRLATGERCVPPRVLHRASGLVHRRFCGPHSIRECECRIGVGFAAGGPNWPGRKPTKPRLRPEREQLVGESSVADSSPCSVSDPALQQAHQGRGRDRHHRQQRHQQRPAPSLGPPAPEEAAAVRPVHDKSFHAYILRRAFQLGTPCSWGLFALSSGPRFPQFLFFSRRSATSLGQTVMSANGSACPCAGRRWR